MENIAGLSAVFFEAVPLPAEERALVEAQLSDLIGQARAAWPGISVEIPAFAAHLARFAPKDGPRAWLAGVHAADLYLAYAVSKHDKAALAAFDQHFIARVPEYVARTTVDRDLVDEIKQSLRERLVLGAAPKIADYSGTGALGGWLRITAVRTALNLLRGTAQKQVATRDEPDTALDPELAFAKAASHDLFREAFTSVLAALAGTERTMLSLHYVEGLTLDQLAAMYRTPRSTVGRRIDEVRKDILSKTEGLLRDRHRLSPSEIESVFRGARSQFHLTLTKILKQ